MSRTLALVVLHVVHAGELGLVDKGVAFSAEAFFDRTGNHTEYVRRTIPLIVNSHLPTLLQKLFLILSLRHLEHRHTVHTISYAYVAAAVSIESVLRNSGQRLKAT